MNEASRDLDARSRIRLVRPVASARARPDRADRNEKRLRGARRARVRLPRGGQASLGEEVPAGPPHASRVLDRAADSGIPHSPGLSSAYFSTTGRAGFGRVPPAARMSWPRCHYTGPTLSE